MKVLISFLLIMVLAVMLILGNCGEEITTEPTTQTTTQPTTQQKTQPTTEITTGLTTEPTTQPTTPAGRPAPKGTFRYTYADFAWESVDPTMPNL